MTAPAPAAERGSASIWVLSAVALIALLASAAVVRGQAVAIRHRAESAADLAALAAAGQIGTAADPCQAAATIAAANHAELEHCRADLAPDGRSGTVAVRVSVRPGGAVLAALAAQPVTASARAERAAGPADAPPAGGSRAPR